MTRIETLVTERAGTLNIGDEFKFQPGGPGTAWQVYTFKGHDIADNGSEHVHCYGGDPIKTNYQHARAWRAFDVDTVRKAALPPGNLASGRRAA